MRDGDDVKCRKPSKLLKAAESQASIINISPENQEPSLDAHVGVVALVLGLDALALHNNSVGLHGSVVDLALLGGRGLGGLGLLRSFGSLALGGWGSRHRRLSILGIVGGSGSSTRLLPNGIDLAGPVLKAVGLEAVVEAAGTM